MYVFFFLKILLFEIVFFSPSIYNQHVHFAVTLNCFCHCKQVSRVEMSKCYTTTAMIYHTY